MSTNLTTIPSPQGVPTVHVSTHSGGAHRGRMMQLGQMKTGTSHTVQMTRHMVEAAHAAMGQWLQDTDPNS